MNQTLNNPKAKGLVTEQPLEKYFELTKSEELAKLVVAIRFEQDHGKRRELMGEVQVQMHGITGGGDAFVQRDAEKAVESAMRKCLGDRVSRPDTVKACKRALESVLWSKIKQRPMVIINIIDV